MSESELKLNGYKLFRCDAQNRHTWGVVIYLQDSISAHIVYKYDTNFMWCLAINIIRKWLSLCSLSWTPMCR